MADQANAPAAPTPPPSAPQPDTPNAQPAPSNIPVGLALDLPGRFGAGWTVSGVDPSGNAILTKPSGDTMTSLTVSAQTLDRARQLRWNRARKPGKQKLTKRSFQFGGIRSDVAAYDAHSDRYLMQVQDAEGRTVTKWVASKDAEKLNNKDIEQAADEFASSLGLKTEKNIKEDEKKGVKKKKIEKTTDKKHIETINKQQTQLFELQKKLREQREQLANEYSAGRITLEKYNLKAKTITKSLLAIGRQLFINQTDLANPVRPKDALKMAELGATIITNAQELIAVLDNSKKQPPTDSKTEIEQSENRDTNDERILREANKTLERVEQEVTVYKSKIQDWTEEQQNRLQNVKKLASEGRISEKDAKDITDAVNTRLAFLKGLQEYATLVEDTTKQPLTAEQIIKSAKALQIKSSELKNTIKSRTSNQEKYWNTSDLEGLPNPNLETKTSIELQVLRQEIDTFATQVADLTRKQQERLADIERQSAEGRISQKEAADTKTAITARLQVLQKLSTLAAGNKSLVQGQLNPSEITSTRKKISELVRKTFLESQVTFETLTNEQKKFWQENETEGTITLTAETTPSDQSQVTQPFPNNSVSSTVSFLRAQNRDRFASSPPIGPLGKATGIAFAVGAAPLLALGRRPSPSPSGGTSTSGSAATTSRIRTTLSAVPAPQQLRIEQYIRSSDTLVQRQKQLTELEERNAPVLDEYDTLIALPGRSPEQETRLQQLLAEHGDSILRPRELLRNQIQASEDNLSSLTNAGARDGFDIPALAAPLLPGAQTTPSAATVEAALPPAPPALKPVGKATGIPSAVRPRSAPGSRPTPRGPGNLARAAAAGLSLLGGGAGSRASNEAAYAFELAQSQQRDRVGGDTRESVLSSEGGSGNSPIETIPQTYGAEPTGEKSERQRQTEMMATQRQLTGGLPQQAGDKIQLGGITIERKADNAADAYRRLREESQRDRQARSRGISASTGVRPRGVSPQAKQALGAAGAVGSALASSGAVDTEALKKQVRRTKWELLLSVEGAPVYMLIGIGQFFGKMFLGKYLPEELKSEWWEDALCGLLILITFELIIMLCMLCFALLSGFAAFINPEQWARAIGGGLSNAVTSVGRAVGL